MARFTPGQIKEWTKGQLLQSEKSKTQEDRFYRGVSTDTRTMRPGEIFLCLRGDRFDGHDFLEEAVEKGAGMLIAEKNNLKVAKLIQKLVGYENMPDILLVEDTLQTYQQIAKSYRGTLLATVIAITGSVSKTTTRRMISTILSPQLMTHETEDNKNNQIGLPLTLLQADDDDNVIIAEMGMDHRGEIAKLSVIAHPDVAIITNIGYSHAEYLESRENILQEKTDIIKGMAANGTVILNGQDEYLRAWAIENKEKYSIWLVSNKPFDEDDEDLAPFPKFWAEDVKVEGRKTSFKFKHSLDPDAVHDVEIPVPGIYPVRAALIGLACAYLQGLDMDKAAAACKDFENTGNRNRIFEVADYLLIDDSYNASPESAVAALDTLDRIGKERRKVVCFGGMKELGRYSEELHRSVGKMITESDVDLLCLVGEETDYVRDEIDKIGAEIETHRYNNSSEAAEDFIKYIRAHDAVLFKGSRAYKMEIICRALEERAAEENSGDSQEA